MIRKSASNLRLCLCVALCLVLCLISGQTALGQRDNDDDFDDAGFDDSGYNQPQNHDAEGSNQNPSNYSPSSEEDLDDDDDVDETHVRPQVADDTESKPAAQHHQQQQQRYIPNYNQQEGVMYRQEPHQGYYANLAPQQFYSNPNSVLLANVDPASGGQMRYKRAAGEQDVEEEAKSSPLIRKRRHSKYIGPVYTYVKTDKHAHYKWGVKHKVGKSKHYG